MKILYVITKSNWGGAQRHVYDLAVGMKAKNHQVIVALGGNGILRKKLEDAGIKTHAINAMGRDIKLKNDAMSLKEIFSIIHREKPDVLHLHSPKAAGLGSVVGRILRIKSIIYTVHGWTFNEDRPFYQKFIIAGVSWLTMLLAHKTILLSKREYEQTLHFPLVREKLVLIPLGIKPQIFMSIDGSRQVISKQIGMDLSTMNKKTIVGTIAELHPNKGLNYLLDAVASIIPNHPNVLCLIIGDGQEYENLQKTIAEKGLGENIKLLGYMDEAAHYIKAFNIFVLSSVKEGLPYVLFEAGFASLPTIATTVGGIPEIIEDMKSGVLVQPKNNKELTHALSFMIEHPSMRRQYGAALRESVIQKFSLDKLLTSINDLYVSTVGR